jgi:hypothetical protein
MIGASKFMYQQGTRGEDVVASKHNLNYSAIEIIKYVLKSPSNKAFDED